MIMNYEPERNANEKTKNFDEMPTNPPELELDGQESREIELIRIVRDMKTGIPIVFVNGKRVKYGEYFSVDVCRDGLVTYDMRGVNV